MRRNMPSNRNKIQGLFTPRDDWRFEILRLKVELAGDNRGN